jgi:hypothetical protein
VGLLTGTTRDQIRGLLLPPRDSGGAVALADPAPRLTAALLPIVILSRVIVALSRRNPE